MSTKAKGNTVNLVFNGEYADTLDKLKAAAEVDERPLSQFILRFLRHTIDREQDKNPVEIVAEATVRKQKMKEFMDNGSV